MIRAMFNATSGMRASSEKLTNISNNIANSQTVGFKGQRTEFSDVFYQQLRSPSSPGNGYPGTNPMDAGNGVQVSAMTNLFSQGNVTSSSKKTDMAIQGEGFFITGNDIGTDRVYTRAGNFDLSSSNDLITQNGRYVLGWNADPRTGEINASSSLSKITIPFGQVSEPKQSTNAFIEGNLNGSAKKGEIVGMEIPTFDKKGGKHNLGMNFIKTDTPGEFLYAAVLQDQFRKSDSIGNAVMKISEDVVTQLKKGDYTLQTAPGATAGTVDITVVDPTGATVFTKNISDTDQNVAIDDGKNTWFTIDYKAGKAGVGAPATFTVGDVGRMEFGPTGKLQKLSDISGAVSPYKPSVVYTPRETNEPVNIDLDLAGLSSFATQNNVKLKSTDGNGASTLTNFTVSDGGNIVGYYSDGTMRDIGRVATATFTNPAGLTREGGQGFRETSASGVPDIGVSNTGSRGQVKALALEMSNVDISTEFVELLSAQRMLQANSKTIQVSNEILDSTINIIR
ncbi:flagellar hook protein FlgE [Bacillus bombysepticus]|uniref:flagellar hook protein FlgE n=1 Tax=Bacillus bombysepticus TaxID=658666 RepID=UPI003015B81A